jgi:hypothetical protein
LMKPRPETTTRPRGSKVIEPDGDRQLRQIK